MTPMTQSFDGYLTQMRARFGGKDAARLPRGLKGTITFLFRVDGRVANRLTLRFADDGVRVEPITRLAADEPTAIVRCSLSDWIAFFEGNDTSRLESIDFFGDAQLIEALPALAAQKTSPLHSRLALHIKH